MTNMNKEINYFAVPEKFLKTAIEISQTYQGVLIGSTVEVDSVKIECLLKYPDNYEGPQTNSARVSAIKDPVHIQVFLSTITSNHLMNNSGYVLFTLLNMYFLSQVEDSSDSNLQADLITFNYLVDNRRSLPKFKLIEILDGHCECLSGQPTEQNKYRIDTVIAFLKEKTK